MPRGLRPCLVMCCLLAACATPVRARLSFDPSQAYQNARSLAAAGKRKQAINQCEKALKKCPDCLDLRVLLGQVLSWEKRYPEAKKQLTHVLAAKPAYHEARTALINVAMWSRANQEALALIQEGLELAPRNAEFWYQRALVFDHLGKSRPAMVAALKALALSPRDKRFLALHQRLSHKDPLWKITTGFSVENFDKTFESWFTRSFSFSGKTSIGTVSAFVNHASRFGDVGTQAGLSWYPSLAKNIYGFTEAAWADDSFFPRASYGLEVYSGRVAPSAEVSLGLRHLRFSSSKTTFYTLGWSQFIRDWTLGYRTFYTPKSVGDSLSHHFKLRHQWPKTASHVQLSFGFGHSPDDRPTVLTVQRLRKTSWGISAGARVFAHWSAGLGYTRENEEFLPGKHRQREATEFSLTHQY